MRLGSGIREGRTEQRASEVDVRPRWSKTFTRPQFPGIAGFPFRETLPVIARQTRLRVSDKP